MHGIEEAILNVDREHELYRVKREAALTGFCRDMNNLKRRVKIYDEYMKELKKNKDMGEPKDCDNIRSILDQLHKLAIELRAIQDTPK